MSHSAKGYDRRGGKFIVATVADTSGRTLITELSESETAPETTPGETVAAIAVPDRLAMVKSIAVEPERAASGEEAARFELLQCLLEPEELFEIEVRRVESVKRWLGTTVRRETLKQLARSYGLEHLERQVQLKFGLRSLALGEGYVGFCHRDKTGLEVVVDLGEPEIALCLIYGDEPVDSATVNTGALTFSGDSWRRNLAISLKTVVNFRLAGLRQAGLANDLTSLSVAGEAADQKLFAEIEQLFGLTPSYPRINEAYLDQSLKAAPDLVAGCLVALGLAAN